MPKNKVPLLEVKEETGGPRVLLLSPLNPVSKGLRDKLTEKGCQVILSDKLLSDFPEVSYIFQFSDFEKTVNILKKAVRDKAKVILVEGNQNKEMLRKIERIYFSFEKDIPGLRIIRIGDFSLWPKEYLAEKIIWAMFSTRSRQKLFNYQREKIETRPVAVKSGVQKTTDSDQKLNSAVIVEKKELHLSLPKIKIPTIYWLTLILIISASPFVIFCLNLYLIYTNMVSAKNALSRQEINQGEVYLSLATRNFAVAKDIYDIPARPLKFIGLGTLFYSWDKMFDLTSDALDVLGLLLKTENNFLAVKEDIFGHSDEMLEQRLIQGKGMVDELLVKIGKIEMGLKEVPSSLLPKEKLNEEIGTAKELLTLTQKLLPLGQEIIAVHEKRTYLVLFQNNMELRPTGGFIGSYGLATFTKGRLTDFRIEDIYQLDGQLKGHVDPPPPIAKYLSQPHWYLRDSNFDPDFLVSANQAIWFLEKESGRKVNGVIGVNLYLIQDLLSALGGLYLNDYQENINSDNLYLKAQVYSQRGFFPGSTQKRDFLGSLGRALLIKLENGDKLPFPSIFSALKKSLEEKNLQLYFTNQREQFTGEELGWGGRTSLVLCQPDRDACGADYLMLVEANLGVNKANYYLSRDIIVNKTFSIDGGATTILTVNYQNDSPSDVFPAGSYKNYLRVLVPKRSTLMKISFNGEELKNEDVTTENYGDDKISFGFFLNIPFGTKGKLQVAYKEDNLLSENDKAYQFLFQKQSGTKTGAFVLTYNYPASWRVSAKNFLANSKPGYLSYSIDTSVDRVFELGFKR